MADEPGATTPPGATPSEPPPPPVPAQPPPPPTYVATTSEWRSLDGLKTALTWLLAANMATTLFVIVAMLNRLGTLDDIQKFGLTLSTANKDEDARDFALTALGIWGLVALATAVVFIVWFFRAAKN